MVVGCYVVDVGEARSAGVAGVAVIAAVIVVAAVPAVADVAVGAVVVEAAAAPVSAVEADAEVPEAVVDATVVADVGAPVAGVPEVAAVAVAPVAGGPEGSGVGCCDPGALYPLVAVTGPGPSSQVSRCSHRRGRGGCGVVGDRWRSLLDTLWGTGLWGSVLHGIAVVLRGLLREGHRTEDPAGRAVGLRESRTGRLGCRAEPAREEARPMLGRQGLLHRASF